MYTRRVGTPIPQISHRSNQVSEPKVATSSDSLHNGVPEEMVKAATGSLANGEFANK
jgi:hypothetical protein